MGVHFIVVGPGLQAGSRLFQGHTRYACRKKPRETPVALIRETGRLWKMYYYKEYGGSDGAIRCDWV
jgi:hypothetical protein